MVEQIYSSLFWLEIFGVAVFALSGANDAVRHRCDYLGVIVLAVATGVGGGIVRDVLLGEAVPSVFRHEIILITAMLVGMGVCCFPASIGKRIDLVKFPDAIGLGLFAVTGAGKAMDSDLGVIGVVFMGTVSAVGGGIIRDVLLSEVPLILKSDFYAMAAILSVCSLLIFDAIGMPFDLSVILAAAIGIMIRVAAIICKFSLPAPKI